MFWNSKKKAAEKAAAKAREELRSDVTEGLSELMKTQATLTPEQQDELKRLTAAAGIIGSSLRIAQTIKKMDAFGDAMHDQTMKMIEEAHEMTRAARQKAPTPDPQQLLDQINRLKETIAAMPANPAAARTEDDAWRKDGCPVMKPVTVGKPLKLKLR
ncbi:MAG: hypothetical protein ACAH80_13820 [Alphaproteobacteria bacterium]